MYMYVCIPSFCKRTENLKQYVWIKYVRSFAFLFFENLVNRINIIKIIKLGIVKHMHTGKSINKTKC